MLLNIKRKTLGGSHSQLRQLSDNFVLRPSHARKRLSVVASFASLAAQSRAHNEPKILEMFTFD